MRLFVMALLMIVATLAGCTSTYQGVETDQRTKPFEMLVGAPFDSVYIYSARELTSYNFPIIETDEKLGIITTDFLLFKGGLYGQLVDLFLGETDFELQMGIHLQPRGDSTFLRASGRVRYQKREIFGNRSTHIEAADRRYHNRTFEQIENIAKRIARRSELAAHPEAIARIDPFNTMDKPSAPDRFTFDPEQQSSFLGQNCSTVTSFYGRGCDILQDTNCLMLCRFADAECLSSYECGGGHIRRVILISKDLRMEPLSMRAIQGRFRSRLTNMFDQPQPFDTVLVGDRLTGERWFKNGFRYALYESKGRIVVSIAIEGIDNALKE